MAVMTLEEYKKKKKEAPQPQTKSSVMTLEEYKQKTNYKKEVDQALFSEKKQKNGKKNTIRNENLSTNRDVSKVLPLTNNQNSFQNLSSNKNETIFENKIKKEFDSPIRRVNEKKKEEQQKKANRIKQIEKQMPILQQKLNTSAYSDAKKAEWQLEYNKLQNEHKKLTETFDTGKTLINLPITIGENTIKWAESRIVDPLIQLGSSKYNPVMWAVTKQTPWSKDQSKLNELQGIGNEMIAQNGTESAMNTLGYNKEYKDGLSIRDYLEKNSGIKRDNFGGKLIGGLTQQGLDYMVANGNQKAVMGSMSVGAYGNGLEEAYQDKATRNEANLYGLLNAGIEYGTEKISPSVNGIGVKDKGLKALVRTFREEGREEVASDLLNPLAKKATYKKDESLSDLYKDVNPLTSKGRKNLFESYALGGISALLMHGAEVTTNSPNVENNIINTNKSNIEINEKTELPVAKKGNLPKISNNVIEENNVQNNKNKADIKGLNQNNINNQQVQETLQNEVQNKQIAPINEEIIQNNNNKTTNTVENTVETNTNIENVVENLKKMRENTTNKAEQIKLDTHIQQLENEIQQLKDNSSTFAQDNKTILPISEQYKTNENMTLQESVRKYGYDPNAKVWKSIEETANKRGMKALMDDTYFSNNSEASIYTKDADGNRMIVYNPNASQDTIIQAKAIHELAHDLMSSDNSKNTLLNIQEEQKISDSDIVKYVEQFDDYAKARQDLEQIYATITDRNGNLVYDPNSTEFKQLIDEEVVAHVLEAKLGTQEFINRLNGQKPSLARRIYNWVMDKIDNLGKSSEYRQEKAYWKNVANRFENAFNMEYNNSSNAASVRLSKNQTTREDFSKALDGDEWYNLYKKIDKHGIESKKIGSKNITVVNDKIVLSENDGTKPNVYDVYQGVKITDEIAEKFGLTTEDIIQDIYEIAEEENVDERKIKRSLEKYFNEGLLRRYDSNNNVFVSKNEYTGENSESNIRNIENESRGRKDLPRTNKTNRELDSSFSYDNEGRKLSKQQQEFFKDSKARDSQGRLITLYHGTQDYDFNEFMGGTFLTDDYMNADGYAFGERIIEAYANVKNPLVIECNGAKWDNLDTPYGSSTREIAGGLDESKYDGIIFKNINDNWIDDEEAGYPGDVYYVPNSNQIKEVDNENPTSNPDIRYSKEAKEFNEFIDKNLKPTGTTGTLMAIHNLSEEKLMGVLELNGFPVPSIAVTNPNLVDHNEFGKYSAIFKKDTIDPKNRKNEIYDRDVWSPTFPRIEYEANEKVLDDIRKSLKLDYKNEQDSIQRKAILDLYTDRIENLLDSGDLERVRDEIKNNKDIQYSYLKEKGLIEPIYKQVEYNSRFSNDMLKQFLEQYQGSTDFSWNTRLNELSYEQTMALGKTIQRIVKPFYDEEINRIENSKDVPEQSKESMINTWKEKYNDIPNNYGTITDFIYSANKMNNNGIDATEIDEYATLDKARDILNKEEYDKWVDDTFNETLINDKGIRNDKDRYTPSGNARSFKATHNPVNLETLVKALSRGNTKGGQEMSIFGTGFGRISAQTANKFNSIKDIKANENRLMSREEASKIIEPLTNKLYADTEELAKYYNPREYKSDIVANMQAMDNTSQAIEEFASKNLTSDNLKKTLSDWGYNTYNVDAIPQSVIDNVIDDLNQAKQLPTDYFEAKPQRAVGLDEVEVLVIPNDAKESTRKAIRDAGIDFVEYDPNIEGDRQKVINKFDNLKFSKTAPGAWQDFVNKHFKSEGTQTKLQDTKLPTKEKTKLPTKEVVKKETKQIAPVKETKIQGLEHYTTNEIKDITKDYINNILEENGYDNINVKDMDIHGSRKRGTAKANSDLDIVVQYDGDIREDDFFNMLNDNGDDNLYIDGVRVDINPIQEDLSSYMKRSNAYDNEVLSKKKIAPVKEKKKDIKLPVKEIPKNPTKESTYDEKAYDRKKQHEKLIKQEVKAKVKGESQKAINIATKVGQKYLELDRTQKAELKEQLSKYTGKTRKQLTNSKTWNEIKDIVNKYAEKQITYVDNEIQDIKTEIKNTKIKIDDNIKSQITDYNDFRKDNFGKLKLSKDGVSLDSMYQELSEQYPYYFNNATTEADMLYELSDFMNKDTNMYEKIKLDDATLERATTKIYNSLLQNTMNKDAINELKEEIQKKYNKRTRKIVQKELQDRMGITPEDLQVGKDISSLEYQRTDPIRLHEKVFGYKIGKKINDATINFTKHQEAERIRFLNQERNEIKDLGIKPRSKESAAVQKYGEKQYVNNHGEVKKYGDADLQLEFPNEKTQQKIKHAASVIRAKYDSYIDNINEVITDMGYDPIPKRKDYMRHFMELNDKLSQWGIPLNRESLSQDALPTDINGITDQFKPGKNWFASTMQRKGLKTTYDAITGIDGYLEGASNLMYHTESIQRYRTLSKLVRDTYGQIHGMENIDASTEEGQQRLNDIMDNKLSKYAAWLDEQANALAGKKGGIDRAAERILGRKVYSVLDTAKKQVGSNMTGFNVRSAMTNFASAVQGASKTNKLAFVKGTVSTVKNMIHNDNLIDESDFLTSRFGSDQLSKKLWQKASNAGQIFMTGTDYFTANQIWRSKYYENLSKGMTKQQAIKNADDFAARIMGDRSKGSTAEIFNSKTLGLLTQFQLEVNNQWSSIIHDNKMDIKSGNKSGATALFQLGQLAAMSYLFNNFMKSVTGSDVMIDPIDILKQIFGGDDDDKSTEEKAQAVLGDLVNDLPFVSFLTGGRIPVSEAFVGPGTFTKKMTGQKDKYGNPIKWEDVKNDAISSGFYWLLPTGYGQIKKTTKGVSMYDPDLPVAGSYTKSGNLRFTADESTGGKIKAALFGQYTNDEAKKYTESGYKTINSTKIDEMKELGMKSSEYRDYRNGLVQAGTKNEDKIDYIVNLDNVTNKQKNIMASNFLSRDFDVKDYKKYDSYEEYNYAYHNPEKYNLITQITTYDKYKKYNEELKEIRDNTKNDKKETIKYINSLNLSIPQKAMYIKTYYKSFKQYDKQIVQYVNGKNLKISEKTAILEKLGFTVRNGRVY